ncbi:MAG: hydrolase, alpha/beta fold family [Acidobacteria bacterium]|nr:hydrolase, alpha/beta fold family [Acidobacteriota bacterium]
MASPPIRHDYAQVGDVRLHYAECGAGDELVILLHGFPECWYSWRHQLPALGEKYHVVAPDMRGYNLSDKPSNIEDYQIEILAQDVLGLIKYFGKEQAVVVGHDWGAAVAWAVAQRHPEVVSKLAALQVPPPKAWQANFTVRQFLSSWYMFFFQLPRIPEWWARANDFARVEQMYRETSFRSGAFTAADLAVYKEALGQPGALTSSLNYYRANVFRSLFARKDKSTRSEEKIQVPTLFIYGELDMAVLPTTVRGLERFVDAPYSEVRIPDSGHWVQNEAVAEVNAALLDFLNEETAHSNTSAKRGLA